MRDPEAPRALRTSVSWPLCGRCRCLGAIGIQSHEITLSARGPAPGPQYLGCKVDWTFRRACRSDDQLSTAVSAWSRSSRFWAEDVRWRKARIGMYNKVRETVGKRVQGMAVTKEASFLAGEVNGRTDGSVGQILANIGEACECPQA